MKVTTETIIFDPMHGKFELAGRFLSENVEELLDPLVKQLEVYVKSPEPLTEFIFDVEYCNTSAVKIFLRILHNLAELKLSKNKIHVSWVYEEEDEDMLEIGKHFESLSGISFSYLIKQE